MSSPIIVNGSTTVISVRARNFTFTDANNNNYALVLLSSINSFGRMVTIFDEDGFLGTGGKYIRVSTTNRVFLDSGKNQNPSIPGADWYIDLTTRNASISVFPRELNQWVLPQTVVSGGISNINNNVIFSGTNFNANKAHLISVSTNLLVYGSTISAIPFYALGAIRTSLDNDSLTVPALQSLTISTGSITLATIEVPSINVGELNSYGIGNTNSVQASTFSSMQTSMSSLQIRTLGFVDNIPVTPSYLMNSNSSTFWNQELIPKETNILFSTTLSIYSTTLPLFDISKGISSVSTIIPQSISSFDGSVGFSSYSTAFINFIQSIDYGPGVSSLSTNVSIGLSSLITIPAISTLSTIISRGLSTVITSPGVSSLNLRFSNMISTLASGPGLSSLSTSVSLGLSTVNATIAFSNVSTYYSFGISDIALQTGLSSLSTPIGTVLSSLYAGDGISSLSSFVFSSLSSLFVVPGISSINQTAVAYYSNLNSPAGISSLSTVMSSLSTYSVSRGLSSLSSVFSLGISTVSVRGALSSISTTFAAGLFNVAGARGASSLSTIVPLVISSLNTSQGASSLFQFIRNQFSTNSDQEGVSSLSSIISAKLSSIVAVGSENYNYPAILTTQIIQTSSVQLLDSTMSYNVGRNIYSTLFLSANVLYIGSDPLDKFVVQSTSRSVISVSSFYANIGGLVSTASLVGTSLRIDNTRNFGISSFVSTVSTQQLVTSSFITSSITFTGVSPRPLSLYLSNTNVLFNGSTFSEFTAWGASSLSTTIFSGVSSFSNIMILQTSSASTSVSRGLSTLNFGTGLSTLSTLISQASTVNFFPGISTRIINVSTGLICTISSFGNISSFLLVNSRLVTSTLVASTIFASNANIRVLNLANSYISSFNFVQNTSLTICSLSTFVTGSGISTGNITIFGSNVSSFMSNLFVNRDSFFSSFVVSTIFLPNLYATSGPAYAPLFLSANNTLWFNGSNIASAGDPNNLSLFMDILSTPGLYASSILTSSLNTSPFIKTDRIVTFESVEITQSTNSMWNRTIYRTTDDGLYDIVQWSYDGLNWNDTNWNQETRFGDDQVFSKPSYNGVYWLIGNIKQPTAGSDYDNSVLYSPDGLNYYALENGQFLDRCVNPTWNGQYWIAGDAPRQSGNQVQTIRRSFDGLIWQNAATGGFYISAKNFAWNGFMWVGVGGDDNTFPSCNVQYSYDGLNWYNGSGEMPEVQAQSVCWNGTLWTVGGSNFTAFTYSYNGINWNVANFPGYDINRWNTVNDIKWNGKIFVAVGQFNSNYDFFDPVPGQGFSILNSLDGINWNFINNCNSDILGGIASGLDWNGEKWIACGCNHDAENYADYAYSYDGMNWTTSNTSEVAGTSNWGQRIGFSSNALPAIETTTLSIHPAAYGYIPMYLTSTNQWQVLPSSIIMNNNFVINKEPNTDRRVGIKTLFPQCTLDINGTMQTNSSTFFSSIVIGSSINFVPRFEFTVIGSTFTNHLTINTPQNLPRSGPLDVWSPSQPILYRQSATTDISTLTSTLIYVPQATLFPIIGGFNPADSDSLYWVWNNGPGTVLSSIYEKLSGTAITFTGQHAVYVSSTSITQTNISSYAGLIVASADQGYLSYDMNKNCITGSNAITSTEALPIVDLTTQDKQQDVFGVLSDMSNSELVVDSSFVPNAYNNPPGFTNSLYGRLLVNSLGDGALWVTNINGNINSGDYLCSCSIPGHARKQDDNGMYNYTVAKATMSCDFDLASCNYRCETIEWNASSFFRAFVGVTYHCG